MSDYLLFLGIILAIDALLLWLVFRRLRSKAGFLLTLAALIIFRTLDDKSFHAALTALIDPIDLALSVGIGAIYSRWIVRILINRSPVQDDDHKN